MASPIRQLADQQHAELTARDDALRNTLAKRYADSYQSIQDRVDHINKQIVAARDQGQVIKPSWLYEQDRLGRLQTQVRDTMSDFNDDAEDMIEDGQADAFDDGEDDAQDLMSAATLGVKVDFARLPKGAVSAIVGRTINDGAPLAQTLARYSDDAAEKVRSTLIRGVVMGYGAEQTGRMLKQQLGGNLGKYMTIARTEVVGAYRDAAASTYQANADILSGWEWNTAQDEKVCPFCDSMDGTEHDLDEELNDLTHPNCRCAQIPKLSI